VRDQPILSTLTSTFGHEQPMMGVALVPVDEGGTIRIDDPVKVINP
jgi:hypothetical protein